ncbi:MAG TPA: presqualene diphosphate synthase HpnD [Rhizomicrobium sp.]
MAGDGGNGAPQSAASGSSFYLAMRLMPKEKRAAMYAIYAYCRAVDDIADDATQPRDGRAVKLDAWRGAINSLYGGTIASSVLFLRDAVQDYGLRREDFLGIIDGMAMDVAEDIRAPELAKLDLYCDRVASAVGRLSIKVFGMDEEPGFRLAHHLGRALQLTNILRDLDEDAGLGRLYLPRELLEDAAIDGRNPAGAIATPAIDKVCRGVADIAHRYYREADTIMRARPRGDLRPPRLMGAAYSSVLSEMEKESWVPPRRRVRLPRSRLLWMFLRHGLAA